MKTIIMLSIALLIAGCSEHDPVPQQHIVYINLEDAKAGYNQAFPLDVNNDGNSEFVFNATLIADAVGDHLRFALLSRSNNEVMGENDKVAVLPAGEQIAPDGSFDYETEVLVVKTTTNNGTSWWGNWKGIQNKYVGIRFNLDGSSNYGWIRISISESNEQIVIHDMAYSSTEILAGQKL